MDVSQSHTSYNQKANKHVVTHSFEIYRIHFLELFHAAFAVRIEDTPDEVINFSKTGRLFTFESQKKLWMKQQILWTAIKINEKRTVEREAPSREMWRRERTAVERAARIVAARIAFEREPICFRSESQTYTWLVRTTPKTS